MPMRKNKKNKIEETEKLDVVKTEENKEKEMAEEAIASETEEKEVPYYIVDRIYNPNEENTTFEVPPGYLYFKDSAAHERLDALEDRLAQMAAYFLGLEIKKREEETTEEEVSQE